MNYMTDANKHPRGREPSEHGTLRNIADNDEPAFAQFIGGGARPGYPVSCPLVFPPWRFPPTSVSFSNTNNRLKPLCQCRRLSSAPPVVAGEDAVLAEEVYHRTMPEDAVRPGRRAW